MDNFGDATQLSTDLNRAAPLPETLGTWPSPQTGEEAARVMNATPKLWHKCLIVCGASSLAAFRPSLCWATTGALPWDQTLVALQDILIGPVAHTMIALVFVGAGSLYVVGGHDERAGRLAASGIGVCVALSAIRLLNYVFP